MTAPDHAENTGDNLRHAAEVQEDAKASEAAQVPADEQQSAKTPPPDFNT
jgi:hypothetical protein